MKKILIIEDRWPIFSSLKSSFIPYKDYINVYPIEKSETQEYSNWGHLMGEILQKDNYKNILDFYPDIDLFIVDLELDDGDRFGLDFLNSLHKSKYNYRKGQFEYIICSHHPLSFEDDLKLLFDSEKNFVVKDSDLPFDSELNFMTNDNGYQTEVVNKSLELLGLGKGNGNGGGSPPQLLPQSKKRKWYKVTPWIERNIIDTAILFTFYLLILLALVYAGWGLIWKTFHKLIEIRSDNPVNPTELLRYVEDVYLYGLPLFIVSSFFSYYKSTIRIQITGGDPRDIDYKSAMKSLNNSKLILLSSLLSFTIIVIIEKVLVKDQTDIVTLISYGIFVIILMAFLLLQQGHSKEKIES